MQDESYIRIALELAKKGRGKIIASPLVGVVIAKHDRIISASFNGIDDKKNYLLSAFNNAKESVEDAVLFTNLEPVYDSINNLNPIKNIIDARIKRVVIGTKHFDITNCGKGIRELKATGIEVKDGILVKECNELNKFYIKFVTKNIPYVTLKIASTLDGKIADTSGRSKWITSVESRSLVHELRSIYDAVLVGKRTVETDDPELTVRLVEGRNPKRVILDTNLSLDLNLKLFRKPFDNGLIIATSDKSKSKKKKISRLLDKNIKLVFIKEKEDGKLNLKSLLRKLGEQKITSLLVEGGSFVYTSIIKEKLYDDMMIFYSPKIIGKGKSFVDGLDIANIKKALQYKVNSVEICGDDIVIIFTDK